MLDTAIDSGILRALRRRRSIPRVKSDRPPRSLIEQVIAAGSTAPNHHKTRPWRFIVLAGAAREDLGRVMAHSARARAEGAFTEDDLAALEAKQRSKPLRAPVVIVVAVVPSREPKIVELEEVASGAAAVENMLLAAQAVGLAAMWRTGPAAYDPAVKRLLELPESAHIVAFVYLGYPDLPQLPDREPEFQSLTRWLGWDDRIEDEAWNHDLTGNTGGT